MGSIWIPGCSAVAERLSLSLQGNSESIPSYWKNCPETQGANDKDAVSADFIYSFSSVKQSQFIKYIFFQHVYSGIYFNVFIFGCIQVYFILGHFTKKNNQLSVAICQRGGRALSTYVYPPTFSTVSLLICHLQVSTCTGYFLI